MLALSRAFALLSCVSLAGCIGEASLGASEEELATPCPIASDTTMVYRAQTLYYCRPAPPPPLLPGGPMHTIASCVMLHGEPIDQTGSGCGFRQEVGCTLVDVVCTQDNACTCSPAQFTCNYVDPNGVEHETAQPSRSPDDTTSFSCGPVTPTGPGTHG